MIYEVWYHGGITTHLKLTALNNTSALARLSQRPPHSLPLSRYCVAYPKHRKQARDSPRAGHLPLPSQ